MRALAVISSLLLTLTLAACFNPPSREAETTPLLLISIDGFRHDYFDLTDTPALDRLVSGGFKADSLHHVFPTKTFPTHYSVVTGRHPGTHGIVANSMWDPIRQTSFSLGNRDAVMDGYWYEGGEPIWVTAEKQGLTAAAMFYPGTEARIHRTRPTYWQPYNPRVSYDERVAQVLEWMDLPVEQRPDLITLYFSAIDSAGHRDGPRSEAAARALADMDGYLLDLIEGLEGRGLLDQMHILLTSDHGMSRVYIDQYVLLDEYLDLRRLRISEWGPASHLWAGDLGAEEIHDTLKDAHPNMQVWLREEVPARFHFGSHHRVPDVLALADLEWMLSNRPYMIGRTQHSLMGMHGWDPAYFEMHGMFVAHGPAFAPGSRSPSMRSIDLYALMADLLEIEPAWHEGTLTPFEPYLESQVDQRYDRFSLQCPGQEEGKVIVGPEHLALHWGQQAHVLLRQDSTQGERFESVGLMLNWSGATAQASIDGEPYLDCQMVALN
ncbi:MAG: ectonucleotide pyrophosphatase/phosphodiesterase [Pseudomonadota bacterium]